MPPDLPPAAQQRLDRAATATAWTSLLAADSATALAGVGLEPAGEVMGCVAVMLSPIYAGGCGYGAGLAPSVRLGGSRWSGYASYVSGMRAGYETAVRRLTDEAVRLGADGVVGIRLDRGRVGEGVDEFVALGTAVRARSATRPPRPFTTDRSGNEVAALLIAGWVPVALHVAVEIGTRHVDGQIIRQTSVLMSGTGNVEVTGYTDLMQRVRASVRAKLRARVAAAGADGGLLSDLHTAHWHSECYSYAGGDLNMLAVASGTSVARFAAPSKQARPVLALRPSSASAGVPR